MATNSWKSGQSGDWTNGADWSTGSPPAAGDQVTIAAPGAYTVTLYTTGACAGLTLNDPGLLFYDAGTLTVSGTTLLQAGTLALAYGSLGGGTLALAGGTLACQGGTLAGETLQGALDLSPTQSTLFVTGGLGFVGSGSVLLTGAYATLDCLGTQALNGATVQLGNAAGVATLAVADPFGATQGATLTLGPSLWLRQLGGQGALTIGTTGGGPPLTDALLNRGTITVAGGTLTIGGPGQFTNNGTIGVSGGGTLDVTAGWTNNGHVSVSGGGTLEFGGTFASSLFGSLGNLALSGGTLAIGGTCENAGGTLSVGAGVGPGPIALAGTIAGGTIADAGGGLLFAPGTGVLEGATYLGTLALAGTDALTLTGGARLATASGAGSATIAGNAALLLEGTELLDSATLTLGSTAGTATLGTTDPLIASQATTATLGAHLAIVHSAGSAAIDANAQTPIPHVGLSDTLISDASIVAAAPGGTLTLGGYGTFINAGTIAVSNNDTVLVATASFSNTGTITVGNGGTVELGAPGDPYLPPAWSNTGVIALAGGTLELASSVSTTALGRIAGTGSVSLLGTLNNAGSTLTLGNTGLLPNLSLTGTIAGGTIVDAAGLLAATGNAELDSVAYQGTLALTGAHSALRLRDGFTLAGTAVVTGAGADLAFVGTETLAAGTIQIGASGGTAAIDIVHDYSDSGTSWLTLGPALAITQVGQLAAIGVGTAALSGDGITNRGTIAGAVAGGTLTLGGTNFVNAGQITIGNGDTLALTAANFSNTGTIAIANASLAIDDSVSLAALGTLALSNASIAVAGTLNEAGGTLTLGAGTAWGRLALTGTIAGGTIVNDGGGLFAQGAATLSGVTFQGALDMSRPFQTLAIANGITLTDLTGMQPGKVILTGPVTRLALQGNETIANATIYIGDASLTYDGHPVAPPALDAAPGSSLTLAANTVVSCAGPYGTLGDAGFGHWTDSITNFGTVICGQSAGWLSLGSTYFTNAGTLLAGGGQFLQIDDVSFTNLGSISIGGGSALELSLWNYYAAPNAGPSPFSNAGTLRLQGGVFYENTGNGLFPPVAVGNFAGGTIVGQGTVIAPIANNGTIEASVANTLVVNGTLTGSGTLLADPGCTLELAGPVAASQTFSFTAAGETLRLDAPGTFAAAVANYNTGDGVDLAGMQLLGLAISAGTLVATTPSANFTLASTSLLGGELAGFNDGHGGTTIVYTAQARGSAPVVIAATTPAAIFWASPIGDIFTGASAYLNAARIGNWSTTDALDATDVAAGRATLAWTQQSNQGVLAITDGTHSASITIFGTLTASWFHINNDGNGGTLITYHS